VLTPVVTVLLLGLSPADQAFGPVTEGRQILTSIYIAIAVVSAGLIAMHLMSLPWAMPMSVALFAVQITYKLITVPMVGLSNPVVITNLVVVVVQAVALFVLWQAHQRIVAAV
jgi:hypothetical protein